MANQEDRIVYFMRKHGHITKMQAMLELGITNLGARINELRWKGWDILAVMAKNTKTGTEYAKYIIKASPSHSGLKEGHLVEASNG